MDMSAAKQQETAIRAHIGNVMLEVYLGAVETDINKNETN